MPPPDFCLDSYRFDLPETLIAQEPAADRTSSRLLVLQRKTGELHSATFGDLSDFLPERCLLVANNSQVIPARLHGRRPSGGRAEFLLLTPPPLLPLSSPSASPDEWSAAEAEGLLRSSKKIRPGERITFAPDLFLELLERGDFGRCRVLLHWQGELTRILAREGSLPLPPYIRRPAERTDAERYQTTYARSDKAGSVAAPTAGLHFTPALRERLARTGREWAEATLYVGYGTFSPVRCDDIREHPMHPEYVELPPETATAITRAKAEGRAVLAVGTTSARVLEGVFAAQGCAPGASPAPHAGWINIFLYPGKPFHVIDGLITNFHLPTSTLLMMVSALAGRETILRAYRHAVAERFRFFSYGDAMLIL